MILWKLLKYCVLILSTIFAYFAYKIYKKYSFYISQIKTEYHPDDVERSCIVNPKKRILLVSMHATNGHKAIGKALKDAIETELGYAVDVVYTDKYLGDHYNFNEESYEYYRANPDNWLESFMSDFVFKSYIKRSQEEGCKLFAKVLDHEKYDMLISVNPHVDGFLYKLIGKVPKIIVQRTDFVDCINHNKNTSIIHIFAGHDMVKEPRPHIRRVSMLPVHSKFLRDKKPRKIRRKELDLPNKPMVLVMFGSCGSYEMEDIMEEVRADDARTYVFICGKNKKLCEDLCKLNKKYGDKFIVLSFVHNIHHWMQAASCMLGKAGGAVTQEVVASGVPLIITSNPHKHESSNAKFLQKLHICATIPSWNNGLKAALNQVKSLQKGFKHFKSKNQMHEIIKIIQTELG